MNKKDSNKNNYFNEINKIKGELIDFLNILACKLKSTSNKNEIKKIEETMSKVLSILEVL